MAVPAHIREQARKADEAFAAGQQPAAQAPAVSTPVAAPAVAQPVETAAPTQQAQPAVAQPPQQATPAAPQKPATRADGIIDGAAQVADLAEARQQLADLGQMFRTLRGKYTAEVPAYAQQVRDLRDQLSAATREVDKLRAEMQARPAPVAPAAAPAQAQPQATNLDVTALFGQKAVDFFGKDELEGILKGVQQVAASEIARTKPAGEAELKRVTEQAEAASQRAYESQLSQLVPDVLEMNNDQGFNAWLDLPDGYSGRTRRQTLVDHHNRRDAVRVAALFIDYKKERELGNLPIPSLSPSQQVLPGSRPAAPPAPQVVNGMTQEDYLAEHTKLMGMRRRGINIEKQMRELDAKWAASRR